MGWDAFRPPSRADHLERFALSGMTTFHCVPLRELGDERWDAFVRRHPQHGPGHLAATMRLERQQGHSTQASFALLDSGDAVVAICPLIDSRHTDLRVLNTRHRLSGTWFPSGPLVALAEGARVATDLLDQVMHQAVTAAQRDGIDQLAISYPAILGPQPAIEALGFCPLRRFGFTDENRVALLLPLDCEEDRLFKGLDTKARNKVRRAETLGCRTDLVTDVEQWAAGYPLYADTLGAAAMPQDAFMMVYEAFIRHGDAFAIRVLHQERLVNVVTVSVVNGAAYYWLGFNDREQAPAGANVLGLWQGIRTARMRGARFFELGSLDFEDGKQGRISAFKQQFGGRGYVAFNARLDLSPVKRHGIALASHLVRRLRHRITP